LIRRGLWRKNRLRFALPLQSADIDHVIEPGDFASAYDLGPTARRNDATITAPVSLYQESTSLSRNEARQVLGIEPNLPAVLIQLGTGAADMNAKLTATLQGLADWKDLQIILTKEPVDSDGVSLIPAGMKVKVIRYFPLANALKAFDGAVTATGYNSVHELLPARIPTVFISNIRGTDDQEKRAKWSADNGFALTADQSDLASITSTVSLLMNEKVRNSLSDRCAELPGTDGGVEIAELLLNYLSEESQKKSTIKNIKRLLIGKTLKMAIFLYRSLKPVRTNSRVDGDDVLFSDSVDVEFLRLQIKGNQRFEHIHLGASEEYRLRREDIARRNY